MSEYSLHIMLCTELYVMQTCSTEICNGDRTRKTKEYFRIPPLFNTPKRSKVLVVFALYCLSQLESSTETQEDSKKKIA